MNRFIEVTDDGGCKIILNTDYIYKVQPDGSGSSVLLAVKGGNGLPVVVDTTMPYEELRSLLIGR